MEAENGQRVTAQGQGQGGRGREEGVRRERGDAQAEKHTDTDIHPPAFTATSWHSGRTGPTEGVLPGHAVHGLEVPRGMRGGCVDLCVRGVHLERERRRAR